MRGDGDGVRRVHPGEFVDRDHEGDPVHSGSSEILGPGNPEQPQLRHLLDVLPGKLRPLVQLSGDGRDLVLGELAHHLADHLVILVEVAQHRVRQPVVDGTYEKRRKLSP